MAKASLKRYRAKRDFTKTAEPSGKAKVVPSKRLRYVIQKHAASRLHYDLRLEMDGVFKSWAVTRGPSIDPADKRLAVEVEDHPLDYGDFEGTIPRGEYGGGTVMLWDRGYWAPEGGKTPQAALAGGDLKFTLEGERLAGSWVLVRMKGDRDGGKRTNWLLIKHRDASAMPGEGDTLLHEDRSVASGRTMDEITRGAGRAPRPFMLAGRKGKGAAAVWHSNRSSTGEDEETAARGGKTRGRTAPASRTRRSTHAAAARASRPMQHGPKIRELPRFIEPQLCKSVDRPSPHTGWGHEVKLDGYRAQIRVERGEAQIRTRTGLDWTERFRALAEEARTFPDCIVDGEIVALDAKGLPSFSALQAALSDERSDHLYFYAFDLLVADHEDLRPLPLAERKERLEALLQAHERAHLRYVAHLDSNGHDIFASAGKMNLEGIVSKKLDAPYRSGRSGTWTKAKCRPGQEVVIGGWTAEKGSVRSLLAGIHRRGVLEYVGRIGTGFGREVATRLSPRLQALTTSASPFRGPNPPPRDAKVRWVRPQLVAEIEFHGWTDGGMIRAAAFKGLREDKPARDVVQEPASAASAASAAEGPASAAQTPAHAGQGAVSAKNAKAAAPTHRRAARPHTPSQTAVRARSKTRMPSIESKSPRAPSGPRGGAQVLGVTISNPAKLMWPATAATPALTKLDLARYFESVAGWMLPHLEGRPCSLVRLPDGIGGEQFFQRHFAPGMSEHLSAVKVRGDKAPYIQIDRVEGIIAAAQFGTIELHPWNCAPGDAEVAGRLVFDLDPAPDVKFDAVIEAAHEVRERLKHLGLESFCKTTGGKGLHVVTPLSGGAEAIPWPTAKNFAHMLCAQMAQDSPRKYLDVMTKALRTGRIFLDYLRNDRTATAVAVLSPRARAHATVSMPLHWRSVRTGLDPAAYTVITTASILRKTKPWSDYDRGARSLADAIRRVTAGRVVTAGGGARRARRVARHR